MSFVTNPTPYHDLPDRQSICVLSILPPIETSQASPQLSPSLALQCDLTILNLTSTPRPTYSALSYSWPDEADPSSISCNGYPVHVRPSLVQALQQIWASNPKCRIWVDAVCINQADIPERNAQVALMGQIYSFAELVIVCLGNESEGGCGMFDLMDYFRSDPASGLVKLQALFRQRLHSLDPGFELQQSFEWVAGRPWFSRCWTFQEIILARTAVLYLGHLRVDWTAFTSFVAILAKYCHRYTRLAELVNIIRLTQRTAADHQHGSPQFYDLLARSKTRRVTDTRDKVF